MSNPFHYAVDDVLRLERVRVVTLDGTEYQGILDRRHHNEGDLLLRGARRNDEDVGATWVRKPVRVEQLDPERVKIVDVDEVEPAPYHCRTFEVATNPQYVQQVRERGHVGSLPVVRETGHGLEIVAGHKRFWVAGVAGLDAIPARIVEWDDWRAVVYYALDHLPELDDETTWATLQRFVDEWGERAHEIPGVAEELDVRDAELVDGRLQETDAGAGPLTEEDVQDEEVPEGADDDPDEPEDSSEGDVVECDVEGCDYETDTERGLAIHQGRVHDDGDRTLEEQIATILEDEGELTSSDIELLLETSSSHYTNVLSRMQREDRVESRPDPDDRRRRLYRLADQDVEQQMEDGPDDEDRDDPTDVPEDGSEDDGSEDDGSEDADGEEDADGDEDGGPDPFRKLWCGHCGAGPYQGERALRIHHGKASHEGEIEPLEEPPEDEEHSPPADGQGGDPVHEQPEGDDESTPRTCGCGVVCETHPEYVVHRVEAHGVERTRHPGPGEFEAIVEEADSVSEIANEAGWTNQKVLRMLGVYGLGDVVGGDVELSDLSEWEFEGVGTDPGAGDPDQQPTDLEDAAAVEFEDWTGGTDEGARRCQNCGSHVNPQFAKVFEPEDTENDGPRCCPHCEDLVRTHDGEIREARSTGGKPSVEVTTRE